MRMIAKTGRAVRDVVVLAMRLYFGLALVKAGLGKWGNQDGTAGYFASLGMPAPALAVYGCVFAEVVGGAALAAGLFSRLAGLLVAANMVVAYAFGHPDSARALLSADPSPFFNEGAFLYLLTGVIVWGGGAGVWSADTLLCGRGARRQRGAAHAKAD